MRQEKSVSKASKMCYCFKCCLMGGKCHSNLQSTYDKKFNLTCNMVGSLKFKLTCTTL
jgi:hypothetical protein